MLLPCEVLFHDEVVKGKEFETIESYKTCVLLGFGTETVNYKDENDEEITAFMTMAIIQLTEERELRKVPIEHLRMQEVQIRGQSNIVLPIIKPN